MKFFFGLVLFVTHVFAAEIDFEHSFIGGSQWGTEDSFSQALQILPETRIPALFKQSPRHQPIRLAALHGKRELLVNRAWEICLDPALGLSLPTMSILLENWVRQLTGDFSSLEPIVDIRLVSREPKKIGNNECDVVLTRGDWEAFPYSQFTPFKGGLGREEIYSIFYRYSKESRSVIVVHPDYKIDLSSSEKVYVLPQKRIIDGPLLIQHEMGHWLGFWHVDPLADSMGPAADLSVMGVDSSVRKPEMIRRRYFKAPPISRFWERRQINLFRSLFWQGREPRLQNDFCLVPGEIEVFVAGVFDKRLLEKPELLHSHSFQSKGLLDTLLFSSGLELSSKGPLRIVATLDRPDEGLKIDTIHLESSEKEFYPVFQFSVEPEVSDKKVRVNAGVIYESMGSFLKTRNYSLRSAPQDCFR